MLEQKQEVQLSQDMHMELKNYTTSNRCSISPTPFCNCVDCCGVRIPIPIASSYDEEIKVIANEKSKVKVYEF